jgi:PAS domain S-box-containing protein
MKFNTALSFVLAGAALWWREQPAVRVGLGALVALIGALTLTEYLSGGDFGIDQLFVSAAAEGPTLPGRMSQSTAFCFFVSGAALGLMRSPRLAEALGLGAATVGGFALLGYALGSEHLYHVPGFVSVAVHTAAAFLFLAAGILCALPQGLIALLLRSRGSGRALWLGFGVLIILLAVTSLMSAFRLETIDENLHAEVDTARPRSEAVSKIGAVVFNYALGSREHLDGEAGARRRAAKAANHVARHLAAYNALTETAAQRELAARFAVLWREFHALGEALMEAPQPGREELERFTALRLRLEIFLDEEMQPEAMAAWEARKDLTHRTLHNTELVTVMLLLAGVVLALLTSSAVARTVLGGEAALRERTERYDLVVAGAHAAVWDWDVPNKRVFFSPQWKALRGLAEEKISDREDEWSNRIHPEDAPRVFAAVQAHFEGKTPVFAEEYRICCKDGSWKWIFDRGIAQRDAAGHVVRMAGSEGDITERKVAEAALRESEERLRQLLRVLPVAVYTCDADGLIMFFNNRAAALWGRGPRLGNPEDRYDGSFRLWRPDGSPLPRERSPMALAIRDGRSIRNQEVTVERPDASRAAVLMNIDPIRAQDGSIIGAINAFVDYTELRQAEAEIAAKSRDLTELKRAEAEIAAKSRDLETLLNVTSHDLREPLRAIENFSRLVQERYGDRMDEEGQNFLQRIIRGAKRLDQLLLDILTISRAQRPELPLEEVNSEDIVRDVLGRLEAKILETGANVRVQKGLPTLRVDRTWAAQAIYNLVVNALKFTRAGEPPDVEIAPYIEPGGSKAIGIAVRDRGPGVLPEQGERIFQLFQRGVGREVEGTGAGLAIVKQVAQRHGGAAWVESRAGGGSVFVITFAKTEREGIQRWTPNP